MRDVGGVTAGVVGEANLSVGVVGIGKVALAEGGVRLILILVLSGGVRMRVVVAVLWVSSST